MNESKNSAGLNERQLPGLRRRLLSWYQINRRELPWRHTRDPYRIWLSEVMLQQTRVAVIVERYEQFLRRFPTLHALSAAPPSSVLAEWSGLGYYRRARNLHAASRMIVHRHEGKFPCNAEQLRALPGIGRYTAAAIASIAFHEPVAVVDGNVERVLSRICGRALEGNARWNMAQELLDRHHPGDFNQALMELGATVCLPGQPRCDQCPLQRFCRTRGAGVSSPTKARQIRRELAYALSRRNGSVFLVQRSAEESLMPGMWELPKTPPTWMQQCEPLLSLRHAITVTNFTVRVYQTASPLKDGSWVAIARLKQIPLTGLARKILRRAEVIK